ncbi:MAG TPA: VWA domain-containing protein [Candidatus Acidoferrum sp.]|nr:VWA domain-containing protein [Candidatus Acidoferrum sp.]
MSWLNKSLSLATSAALALSSAGPLFAQQAQNPVPAKEGYSLHATTELVLVNVIAHDKKGNLVRDLKKDDFTVYEDGQKQQVTSFDFENVDALAMAGPAEATVSGTAAQPSLLAAKNAPAINARDRRLMLFFFDFSAMEPEQIDRAVDAAKTFVQTKMEPADLIAIVSLSTDLRVDLDFTDDRAKVLSALSSYASSEGQGFDNGSTGSAEGAAETGGSFTADDTDYNTFSADRKILALQSIMQILGKIPQKKSLIYFSNGITQSGVDNQSALRAATASAMKANVSIYPLDVRGLQAFPPGGEAQSASLHGQSAYSGAAVLNDLSSNAASQETLSTLASDTGGKAFFDTNDFSGVFREVQRDTSAYYVLGYTSTNHLKDGHFRRIRVKINRQDIKLEYRAGYYADRDFQHLQKADREEQLDDELASELPQTDVAVYAGTAFFRKDDSHYYLAVSLVVPGSQIPFVTEKDKDNAMIDIIGEVLESGKFPVGRLRDTVKLAVDSSQQVRRKNVQYNTSFLLAPGSYHLKFIVRENRTGRMGSFETDVQIPDLRKAPLKMSSVVLSSKRVPVSSGKKVFDPLVSDGEELVPSVTHVFTQDQHLYLQFELYDPAKEKNNVAATNGAREKAPHGAVRVLTSIELLQGGKKVYESKPVRADELNAPDRKAVSFRFDLPLQSLKPGFYTCQVNVIDDAGGNFTFPRWPILVKSPVAEAPRETPPATGRSSGH